MRKAIENLLVWFVPVAFLTFAVGTVATVFRDREILELVAGSLELPALQLGASIRQLHLLILAAGNIVIAVWLALQQHASLGRRILWSLFGIASGLWALAIWLLVNLPGNRPASDG